MRYVLAALFITPVFAACQAVPEPAEPSEPASEWRDVAPENLLLINTIHGQTAIELNPDFAPNHVDQIRTLVADQTYDGTRFYRVIDGFVAQGGLRDATVISKQYQTLENENDRPVSDAAFAPLGNDDLFAADVGHINGFPAARDETLGREWLLHCPGAIAMARDVDPDSGGTEFYIVLDAQRYLDRNLTIFGRVIDGMQYIQKLKRGDRAIESGVIQAPEQGDEILSMRLARDLPADERPAYRVMETPSAAFEAAKTAKRVRQEDFFYREPPHVLDICGFETPVERIASDAG